MMWLYVLVGAVAVVAWLSVSALLLGLMTLRRPIPKYRLWDMESGIPLDNVEEDLELWPV